MCWASDDLRIVSPGADDIFVYMDAWKQSAYMTPAGTDLAGRTEWTLRRAGGAMLDCCTRAATLSS